MEQHTDERVELYAWATPEGDLVQINLESFEARDDTPTDGELRVMVVLRVYNGRSGGSSGIRGEGLKGWLRRITLEEKEKRKRATQEGHCGGDEEGA